jgi:hypothetical protein
VELKINAPVAVDATETLVDVDEVTIPVFVELTTAVPIVMEPELPKFIEPEVIEVTPIVNESAFTVTV